jgi:RNA polymerase II subunit A-like phosphatase
MDEPRSSSATAPDTASSPAPPDAQQISSDPEPDADDWDVEPGSRKGDSETVASGVAVPARRGGGTIDEDELDDLKRIEEQSRNLELSLSWEDVDEELREFLAASGDEEDEDEDEEDGDDDDAASSKGGMNRKSENSGGRGQRAGDETGRYASFSYSFFRRQQGFVC